MATLHVIEPGGQGGVFQHAVAVAEALERSGISVVLHTADDLELHPAGGVSVCTCVRWRRALPRLFRRVIVAAEYVTRTLPHLIRRVKTGDYAHFQGLFFLPLTLLTLVAARARGATVVHSAHNTFPRYGGRVESALLRLCARVAHATVVFSEQDRRRIEAFGGRPVLSPLLQSLPPLDAELVRAWRTRWQAQKQDQVVLFAGQIRRDKRLDLLIRAASDSAPAWKLAVVGEDKGDAGRCQALAAETGVDIAWDVGFQPLDKFAAALAAADLVVCPYDRASQSGVLAVATQVGVPTVATDVGGLSELADRHVPPGDAHALTKVITEQLLQPNRRGRRFQEKATVAAHLSAYGIDLQA